ncbi:hypothetical protein Tco_1366614, partial [Tanacetum coccineum]
HSQDVLGRINLLKEEASRIAENRRLASTYQKRDTPHEMWFHNEYMGQIKAAISQSSISLGEVAPQQLLKFRVFFSF